AGMYSGSVPPRHRGHGYYRALVTARLGDPAARRARHPGPTHPRPAPPPPGAPPRRRHELADVPASVRVSGLPSRGDLDPPKLSTLTSWSVHPPSMLGGPCVPDGRTQTRAVSWLNRQTAPPAKIASHAMTLTIQVQSTPPPSSGACTSWLSPYSGDHLAMSCIACGSRLIGMNRPPTKANSDMIRPRSCGTASAGTRNPMNSPNAAKSSEPRPTHRPL